MSWGPAEAIANGEDQGLDAVTGCVVHTQPVYTTAPPPPAPVVVAANGETVVTEAPPPLVQETVIAAPGPGFIWIGGHWRWEGGHWARPPCRSAVWVARHCYHRGGRHVWVRGGWR
jgi:hypothetical protein